MHVRSSPRRGTAALLAVMLARSLALVSAAEAQAPVPVPSKSPAQVSGAVLDADGVAMPGVEVTMTSVAGGQTFTTTTDERGFFQFPNVPPGDLTVKAAAQGFAVVTAAVSASAGAATTLTLRFASGPVPVTGPGSAARSPLTVIELTPDGAALSQVLSSQAANQRVLSAVVSVGAGRSLLVFEKSAEAASACELVPATWPVASADLEGLLAARPRMRFLGIHRTAADSSVVVFRHER